MTTRKKLSQSDIVSLYMEYVTEYAKAPSSEEHFFKKYKLNEDVFYEHFHDFTDLEEHILYALFEHTLATLEKSDDYYGFEPRDKVLSFYFTFFELLAANRTYMLYALKSNSNILISRQYFAKLRNAYKDYIESLDIDLLQFNQETIDNIQLKSFKESAWLQLFYTIKFWQDDYSEDFEKTDVLIEKSLKATFDLIDTQPLKSVIDLGKFLIQEKFQNKK